jgi:signal transduction histidine kinase/CheY-like chemotaxis protein
VAAPMLEIDGSVRSALSVAGIGLLAALLLASALAALLGRRLAQSIAVASESAHALANGEPFPAAPSGITELDALHAAHRDAAQVLVQARHLRSAARAEREKLIHAEQVARRRAEADVVAKDNFMAMLGHELRNPLNAMTGAIGVLDDPHTPPAGRESAQRILRRQNRQLAHIVDDLLDFNRMALGKISLETVPVELCHAARMCLEAARTSGSRHRLTLNEGDCPVWVRADPTRLEQIISNLLGNAMKFSDSESEICLTVGRVGEQAQLLVGDQGIGIAADLLPLIFDPFVQGPATLDRARSGLGIGLSLVRQLVTLHGGGIAAASTGPGCGSVFTLHLPAIEAPVTVDSGAAPAAAAEPQGVSVLLVEDNPDSREMIRTLLEMHGFQVSEAGTGADGIALARSLQPAVAVVDVGLPDIDGYTVATTLCADRAARQRQPGSVRTGLIALTGYGQPGDRERALAAGFDVHLVKPLQLERLLAAIAACTEPAASISNQAS